MAGTDQNTVKVLGNPNMKENTSAVALTVGMVVQEASTGKLALSSVASAVYQGGEFVVTEAAERGKGIFSSGTTINTYAIGEQVPVIAPRRGDEILLLLTDGQTISKADMLMIAATGKAIAHTGDNLPFARALEALSPSGADGLILARKL